MEGAKQNSQNMSTEHLKHNEMHDYTLSALETITKKTFIRVIPILIVHNFQLLIKLLIQKTC